MSNADMGSEADASKVCWQILLNRTAGVWCHYVHEMQDVSRERDAWSVIWPRPAAGPRDGAVLRQHAACRNPAEDPPKIAVWSPA